MSPPGDTDAPAAGKHFISSDAVTAWWNGVGSDRRRGILCLLLSFGITLLLMWLSVRPIPVNEYDVRGLLHNNRWVSYDPLEHDPLSKRFPSDDSIRSDLLKIKRAGFTGIVTMSSNGTLAHIPAIARQVGLEAIMGVWDPRDLRELDSAARQYESVSAYCVGHDRIGAYSFTELKLAIAVLRRRTKRPVTTCDYLANYREHQALLRTVDWLLVDVQSVTGNPSRDAAKLKQSSREAAALAATTDKPLMLGMVSYPCWGIRGVSLESQADFFRLAVEQTRPREDLRYKPAIMFHGAFDVLWKERHPDFRPWDPYTGLLEASGTPRPALAELVPR